jgi:hypothetical protein
MKRGAFDKGRNAESLRMGIAGKAETPVHNSGELTIEYR